MAARYADKMECHYKVHCKPGNCGKCKTSFAYHHPMQYFCEKCRSLPISDWIEWMDKENRIAIRRKLEAKAALLKSGSSVSG